MLLVAAEAFGLDRPQNARQCPEHFRGEVTVGSR